MLFSVLCTMLLGLCIMKRERRRVIMSTWRIAACHCACAASREYRARGGRGIVGERVAHKYRSSHLS